MRVVLDTNQLVSALVRPPELATFIMAWESARFTVVASPALLEEYQRVLTYPDVAKLIQPELLRTLRNHLLEDVEIIEPPEVPRLCRDADDDKVVAVAIYGWVDYLLTVDNDLLTAELVTFFEQMGITVLSGDELIRQLDLVRA